jgi:TPR repeat protein
MDFQSIKETAERGDADAQRRIGEMYYAGEIVTQNYIVAAEWYKMAAIQGDAESQYKLGDMYWRGLGVELNLYLALTWFKNATVMGHSTARKSALIINSMVSAVKNDKKLLPSYKRIMAESTMTMSLV